MEAGPGLAGLESGHNSRRQAMVNNLGHVGLICDDSFKMRDFYIRSSD